MKSVSEIVHEGRRDAKRAVAIANTISPIMEGLGPEIQGAVLAQLLSRYLGGFRGEHADRIRDVVLGDLVGLAASLVVADDAMRSKMQ